MPRRPRRGLGGYTLHVLNRGARRGALFTSVDDYRLFEKTFCEALERYPVDVYDYCLMPNHFHLVVRPPVERDLVNFMHWLTSTHAVRWRLGSGTIGEGAVYQGRYKAVPIETGLHFLTVCRYVALNPVRAHLVKRAESWRWSAAARYLHGEVPVPLARWPVARPAEWLAQINEPLEGSVLEFIRTCVKRGCPIGNVGWQIETAKSLGILHTLRPRGRPKATPVADRSN